MNCIYPQSTFTLPQLHCVAHIPYTYLTNIFSYIEHARLLIHGPSFIVLLIYQPHQHLLMHSIAHPQSQLHRVVLWARPFVTTTHLLNCHFIVLAAHPLINQPNALICLLSQSHLQTQLRGVNLQAASTELKSTH